MLKFAIQRLMFLLPTLIGATLVAFFLIRLVPGDPVANILGERGGSPEKIAEIRARLGLDRSLPEQYFLFIKDALSGDLGTSIASQRPVKEEFWDRFPATIELGIFALAWAVLLGIPLGIWAAVYRGKLVDWSVTVISLVGYSMPIFWWGLLLIILFSVKLGWLPVSGRLDLIYDLQTKTGFNLLDAWFSNQKMEIFSNSLKHLILPAFVLGTVPLALICRMTRTCILEVLNEDYVRTARSKGIPTLRLYSKHVLKNALVPLVNMIGILLGTLVTGAFLTETLFSWPGVGRWLVKSIEARDYPVLQGGLIYLCLFVVMINFVVDMICIYLNPKLRRST
ncbi:MAG: ABC transporter permease [Pseudobdellovibrionaceae bacterium]